MKASFSLIDRPWIPCMQPDGSLEELNLPDVLVRAHDLSAVHDPSPLVTISLYRLLLAILHRNFGPGSPSAWRAIWDAAQFDSAALEAYFDRWHSRFDLFDEQRPFYQDSSLLDSMRASTAKLSHEAASGNNGTLFDHTFDDLTQAIPPAAAARKLIAQQNFALGGIQSGRGATGKSFAAAAPLTAGAVHLMRGENLFATLMLNLVRYSPEDDLPFAVSQDGDAPAWEQELGALWQDRIPRGYLDYLTWQSRRVKLHLCPVSGLVGGVALTQGNKFPHGCCLRDPQMAHSRNVSAKQGSPWPPLRFRGDRAMWRDSTSLLVTMDGLSARPAVCEWVAEVTRGKSSRRRLALDSFGLCSSQAKVFFWRHETLPVSCRYLEDDYLADVLQRCLRAAERVAAALGSALWALARHAALPTKPSDEITKNDTDAISKQANTYPAHAVYWASLEVPFKELLQRLSAASAEGTAEGELEEWIGLAQGKAADALDRTLRGLRPSARNLRAAAKSRAALRHTVNDFTCKARGGK